MKAIKIIAAFIVISALGLESAARAGAREEPSDPLMIGRAVADRELFGAPLKADDLVPAIKAPHNLIWFDPVLMAGGGARPWKRSVKHDLIWLDATLMAGLFGFYDRMEETGSPVPRYLAYLEAWADRDPGRYPFPVIHGDWVTAGQTYIWLYERSGRTSNHLQRTDGMIQLIFKGRKFTQWRFGYNDYWMRFWQDDVFMIAPFLAYRGQAVGNAGIPDGKDAREIAVEYCRAYAQVLRDPVTGLFWHNPRARGDYLWGRGNGWVAAGYMKVLEVIKDDPAYAEDAQWLKAQLTDMARTLKANRNAVGTWNADIVNRAEFTAPETSGSAFFTFMIARMVNLGYLPREEYLPVALKAWHFLKLSVTGEGDLLRVQPVGRGPIKRDFEDHSETYGVGAFLLAAAEVSKFSEEELEQGDEVECLRVDYQAERLSAGRLALSLDELKALCPDFPENPAGRVQAVMAGQPLLATEWDERSKAVIISGLPPLSGPVHLFYQP